MMNKLMICVTSFNRLAYTKLCLAALEACEGLPFDCIIVDNNSNQETKEYLKQYEKKTLQDGTTFDVIYNPVNYGVGKALNRALARKYAQQHFMKLDNDTLMPSLPWENYITPERVNKRCLWEMVDVLENSTQHVSALGALLFDRNRVNKAPRKIITTTTGNTYITENFSDSHINGACQLYHKDTIINLGIFSEEYIYGYEDSIHGSAANRFGLGLACEWLWIAHIDNLKLPEAQEILEIKRKSLAREIKVPK